MYGFSTELDGDINDIELTVREELKTEGFGVLTEIDVQAAMKEKLGIDKRPYKILGACNPPLANQAIDAEPDIGLLLPCNVLVRETEAGRVRVAFMDPQSVLSLIERDDIHELAEDVRGRLIRVRERLGGEFQEE